MLCELKIENLALIQSLHLHFDTDEGCGLVVMTGETGYGCSLGAAVNALKHPSGVWLPDLLIAPIFREHFWLTNFTWFV